MSGLRSRLRNEMRNINKGAALTSAVLLVVVWVIVLFMVGSPRMLLRLVGGRITVLPSWLFLILAFAFYVLCGFAIGAVLFDCRPQNETAKYRGAFFFSIAITLSYLWYALFFGARFFLPALVLAVIFTCGFAIAAVNFRAVSGIGSFGMWFALGWSVYLLLLSLLCFFFL